ncbi:MAG: cytochrome c3 family protein [Proteobacteria bacterium]|nr:cytochrome c3 family protein [Pseudomonadota bacterium]
MKLQKLIKTAGRFAIVAGLLLAGGSAIAAVATTKHNLGSGGPGPNTFSGTAEICVFCHTPHGSDISASVPLWNRTLGGATYTTYDSLGTSSLDGATAPVGSVSIACLSCHDGTQAMDSVINAPNTGMTGTWTGADRPAGNALIGTDLQDDHPIGIQYGGGGITVNAKTGTLNDSDFVAPLNAPINGTTIWWVETGGNTSREKTDMQLYTRSVAGIDTGTAQPFVECASCHDPHTTNATFLRISNAGSAVCLACHTK